MINCWAGRGPTAAGCQAEPVPTIEGHVPGRPATAALTTPVPPQSHPSPCHGRFGSRRRRVMSFLGRKFLESGSPLGGDAALLFTAVLGPLSLSPWPLVPRSAAPAGILCFWPPEQRRKGRKMMNLSPSKLFLSGGPLLCISWATELGAGHAKAPVCPPGRELGLTTRDGRLSLLPHSRGAPRLWGPGELPTLPDFPKSRPALRCPCESPAGTTPGVETWL